MAGITLNIANALAAARDLGAQGSQATKLVTEPTALPWDRLGLNAGDARWYWLRSISPEGNVSALIGPVTATAI